MRIFIKLIIILLPAECIRGPAVIQVLRVFKYTLFTKAKKGIWIGFQVPSTSPLEKRIRAIEFSRFMPQALQKKNVNFVMNLNI
jgi:hypothetical protein